MSVKVVSEPIHAVSALKSAVGGASIVMEFEVVSEQLLALWTIRVTVNVPLALNACCGFCAVELFRRPDPGSPKSQYQETMLPPPPVCDRSVKGTSWSSQLVAAELKLATGDATRLTTWETECSQLSLVFTVRVTV